jgi:hypothetical protein
MSASAPAGTEWRLPIAGGHQGYKRLPRRDGARGASSRRGRIV